MANFDNLRKQAKQLVRWHRAGNYSVGGRIRSLPRYRNLTDVEALALKFPLSEAQEIIALEVRDMRAGRYSNPEFPRRRSKLNLCPRRARCLGEPCL